MQKHFIPKIFACPDMDGDMVVGCNFLIPIHITGIDEDSQLITHKANVDPIILGGANIFFPNPCFPKHGCWL